MKRLWWCIAGVIWGVGVAVAGQPLTAVQAFRESDVVAYIKVREVAPMGGDGKYSQTARVEVYEPIKGCREQDFLDLDFDTGLEKSNVLYAVDEKAMVVLRRLPTGHFETVHDYCGKFLVEQGQVLDCYLLGEPGKVPPYTPLDEAVQRLRQRVAEIKREAP